MNIIFKIDTWQEIYHSLRNNKLRTFLTMIGVGWGMFLFVALLGAAKGMENGSVQAIHISKRCKALDPVDLEPSSN